MLMIIEGRAGKSKVVEKFINEAYKDKKVAIFDTVLVYGLNVGSNVDHYLLNDWTDEQVIDAFTKNDNKHYDFTKFDCIVFEVNTSFENAKNLYKPLAENTNQDIILTVQDEFDGAKIRFI